MQQKRNKILIVEDSKDLQYLIIRLLEPLKEVDILVARNGVEALMTINKFQESIKLVLLDVVMPQMDGYGLLLRLNKLYEQRPFKICMLTSLNKEEAIARALKLKVDNYIIKPIDRPIFMKTICGLLKNFDGDNEKFATREVSINTALSYHSEAIHAEIKIFEISEFHIAFKTDTKLNKNSTVRLNLRRIGVECELNCKLTHEKEVGKEGYEYIGQFIALEECNRKQIRSFTIRSADNYLN